MRDSLALNAAVYFDGANVVAAVDFSGHDFEMKRGVVEMAHGVADSTDYKEMAELRAALAEAIEIIDQALA